MHPRRQFVQCKIYCFQPEQENHLPGQALIYQGVEEVAKLNLLTEYFLCRAV